jgi:hypothetical protein
LSLKILGTFLGEPLEMVPLRLAGLPSKVGDEGSDGSPRSNEHGGIACHDEFGIKQAALADVRHPLKIEAEFVRSIALFL